MKQYSSHISSIWLKASVVGSIWASIEIIFGSFLHNLKMPLSGMILSFISVWLLVSFIQIWKENGLIWRAGLICALMKSISPSAFILGPMIGIFTEALLIEFFIFIFGKNIIGYIVGGALAVLSTLIHKLISLLVLYGFDFIKIVSDLYQFAVKQINIESLSPSYLLVVITSIYILTGFTSASLGYFTGSKYSKRKPVGAEKNNIILNTGNQLISQSTGQDYSLLLLIINLFSIITILLLINYNLVLPAIIAGSVYVGFCIFKYKNSLKRLKKFSFWVSFLIITFAATFLWDGFSHGVFFSMNGLVTGLKMNARAVIMIVGFASFSVELKNPVIKSVLYQNGLESLYQSLNLSFSALPYLISNLSKQGNTTLKKSGTRLHGILSQADILYTVFEKNLLQRPPVVIITGDIHQGKTTFAQNVVTILLEHNIRLGGFLSIGINDNGKRTGFNLYDIETGEILELCSDHKEESRINYGPYYFNRETLAKGIEILNKNNLENKHLIVIDEIGPLELNDKGWSSAIEDICRHLMIPQLWVVRRSILNKILRKWNTGNIYVYDIASETPGDLVSKIKELIQSPIPV